MSLNYISVSELGLVRSSNQDRVLALDLDHGFLAVVCDGIGGGNAGDIASQTVIDVFESSFKELKEFNSDQDVFDWFSKTLDEANLNVFQMSMSKKEFRGMGTTIIALVINKNKRAFGFNVGDSRLYEYRHNQLNLLSHDQTYAYQMYLENEISKSEIETHPRKNVLINAVGIKDKIDYELIRVLDDWNKLLLSSDGLHDFVQHAHIEETFKLPLGKQKEVLKEMALSAGGMDNISYIIIEEDINE